MPASAASLSLRLIFLALASTALCHPMWSGKSAPSGFGDLVDLMNSDEVGELELRELAEDLQRNNDLLSHDANANWDLQEVKRESPYYSEYPEITHPLPATMETLSNDGGNYPGLGATVGAAERLSKKQRLKGPAQVLEAGAHHFFTSLP
ncbi:hypothetical protein FRB95_000187 [Tulasnella sp. JGI-2019a]|nr:hypothetical protein FRB95_000187 [Tulasnella sp. JGI-2019a]